MLALQGITMDATSHAIAYLAERIWPAIWARPVKRVIQRDVLNKLSKEILVLSPLTVLYYSMLLAESWF
jgi:ATP-dependent Clp protease ATP-binding subunit ClpB